MWNVVNLLLLALGIVVIWQLAVIANRLGRIDKNVNYYAVWRMERSR